MSEDLETNEILDQVRLRFALGDIVFLRVREDRQQGMITGIIIRPGFYVYLVSWSCGAEMPHFEIELTAEFHAGFDS